MRSNRFLLVGLALAAGLATTACRPKEQKAETISTQEAIEARESLPPEVRAQLDSGNAAYGSGDHKAALAYYTKAKDLKNDAAAAWFGIYMAQNALGDEAAAKEALAHAQKLSPGATLIHPTATDTAR